MTPMNQDDSDRPRQTERRAGWQNGDYHMSLKKAAFVVVSLGLIFTAFNQAGNWLGRRTIGPGDEIAAMGAKLDTLSDTLITRQGRLEARVVRVEGDIATLNENMDFFAALSCERLRADQRALVPRHCARVAARVKERERNGAP